MAELDEADAPLEAPAERRRARRPQGWPITRVMLGIAIAGPALYFGGTRSETVVAFLVVVLALWVRLCTRSPAPITIPRMAWVGALLVGITLLQCAPIAGIRAALAPALDAQIDAALLGTSVSPWPSLSPTPADTGLEAARLIGLLALFVVTAQLSWRTSAMLVATTGCVVALIGYAHQALGLHAIYGRYAAEDVDFAGSPALLTTFVNANHQSSLLLLGAFAAGALAYDQHVGGMVTRDPAKVDRHADRHMAAIAALGIQLPALILSLSRGAIVALVLVGPVAVWLGLRRDPKRKSRAKRERHMTPLRWIGLLGMVVILLIVAQHGAWRELGTLRDVADPDSEAANKLAVLHDVPALLAQSPWLGIGRGAFIDVYPPLQSDPSHVLYTHLESTPANAIVEWGPVAGGAFLLATIVWWISAWRRDGDRRDIVARRIVLLGLLAMALHAWVDYALEFLGVAAPAVALVGGLSRGGPTTRVRVIGPAIAVPLAAAIALAILCAPHGFTRRETMDRAMLRGEIDASTLLRVRPLDGRLHQHLARQAARAGDWSAALTRAVVATTRAPGAIDAWLLRAAAEDATGDPAAADVSLRTALEHVHAVPAEDLRAWLLARHPDPHAFAGLTPDNALAWQMLVQALIDSAPAHADAIAAARTMSHPDDPAPLRVRFRLAMQRPSPALALHHARLWRQVAPHEGASHRAVAIALRMFDPPRVEEARAALEDALKDGALESAAERGLVEEELLRILLAEPDAASRARAREIAEDLRTRPANRATQKGREPLLRAAASAP